MTFHRQKPGFFVPNTTIDGDGFYISHNDCDVGLYGCETTALVVGQMGKFYILRGDHRNTYSALVKKGFAACLDYYRAHVSESHEYSDTLREEPIDVQPAMTASP